MQTKTQEKLPETFAESMGEGWTPQAAQEEKPAAVTVAEMDTSKTSDAALNAEAEPPADPKKAQTPATVKQAVVVELNARGLALPTDIDAAYRIADMGFRGGAFPKWVKSAIQALAVSQFCRALGLEPMTGMQHVCEVNGRLSLWGEGPLAAVRASGKMVSIQEIFLTKDYKKICLENKNLDAEQFAATCIMVREGGERVERSFTNKDEMLCMKGLPNVWKGYQRVMYKRKARAEVIKDLFGDVVAGAGIAEWDANTAPDLVLDSEPQKSLTERLNERGTDASE